MNVFIVTGGVDYEGSSPLRAFNNKDDADEFAGLCRAYERTAPTSDSDDPQQWITAHEAWRKGHPAGEDAAGNDYYCVTEIELVGSGEAPAGGKGQA